MARLILLLAAWLFAATPVPAPEVARPALWRVQGAQGTAWLFGTVHVLRPGLAWFAGPVAQAFSESDTLVLEIVPPPEAGMRRLIVASGASSAALPARIGPALDARLEAALPALGIAPHALDATDPWFAATTVSITRLARLGYGNGAGVETVLARAAARQGKRMTGLETARGQFAIFDTLSDAGQRQMLAATLDGLPDTRAQIERTVAAWRAGDVAALGRIAQTDLAGSPELRRALLTGRNTRWAALLTARLRQPGTLFVAVGAGHLAGPEGLPALLAERGLRVTRVR